MKKTTPEKHLHISPYACQGTEASRAMFLKNLGRTSNTTRQTRGETCAEELMWNVCIIIYAKAFLHNYSANKSTVHKRGRGQEATNKHVLFRNYGKYHGFSIYLTYMSYKCQILKSSKAIHGFDRLFHTCSQ